MNTGAIKQLLSRIAVQFEFAAYVDIYPHICEISESGRFLLNHFSYFLGKNEKNYRIESNPYWKECR